MGKSIEEVVCGATFNRQARVDSIEHKPKRLFDSATLLHCPIISDNRTSANKCLGEKNLQSFIRVAGFSNNSS